MITSDHPGFYIRKKVLPKTMPVKEAAKLLGIGRPALSNLLNGKAALSPEMAARLEKVFGADPKKLLKLQAEFEQYQQKASAERLAIGAYVPSWRKITAKDIEQWSEGIRARSLLPVLLRKLVNSTGHNLSKVDFPGYDQAEKKGWDGYVQGEAATPWIPIGKSGWEFGCNLDPKRKAEDDYAARIKSVSLSDRKEIHFVFVTPKKWNGKDKWVKEKQALGDWKSVRVFDASDIEQWLEQSLQAQGWLSEQRGLPSEGVYSLDEQWSIWASVTDPELSKELFASPVEHFKDTVKKWIENPPSSPLIVCGDSKLEALAFLYCTFENEEPIFKKWKDRLLVFSSGEALRKLTTASPTFLPIVFTDEAERELRGIYKDKHTIIIRPRNTVEPEPDIALDLLRYDSFKKALEAMGINDHLTIDDLARGSGYSPTILRRRLAKAPAIRSPMWAQDNTAVRKLIPMMFVGAWHTQSRGDCEIMFFLAGKSCDETEKDMTELLHFDDPPVWSSGNFRGVTSKIDAFYAVQDAVTRKELEDFFFAAETVLSEKDPALELPEDKRAFANLYGKSREHSDALRDGICETLILLAVHGNNLFAKRLGIDVEAHADTVVQRLLTPLTPDKLLSQSGNLPLYAEASPQVFLRIIEEDLKSPHPQIFSLMKTADTGIFGSGCPRAGLLWALENLAWKSEQLGRVSLILAKLSEHKIDDNWANTPISSLQAIFRSWMPQTAATLEERKKALEALVSKYPAIGWEVCVAQFSLGPQSGDYNHRPRWRNDASGAGQPLTSRQEINDFGRKALDIALAWPLHDERTLGDLLDNLQGLPKKDQVGIWNLINKWAKTQTDENRKAFLRNRVRRFVFRRRTKTENITAEERDRAIQTYNLLTPANLVTKHLWLFEQQWVHNVVDEFEEPDLDYWKQEERLRKRRITALQEIWHAQDFEGVKELLLKGGNPSIIGSHMVEDVMALAQAPRFLEKCLQEASPELTVSFDETMRTYLTNLKIEDLIRITQQLMEVLPPISICRLLKCLPFQRETWAQVDLQEKDIQQQYWREVYPEYLSKESPDLNEAIDRLLEAHRPRAAFHSVQFGIEKVETSRLKHLLEKVGTSDSETPGTYRLDSYHLARALNALQNRIGVREEEMAQLELFFISALRHTDNGIPNLEKQIGKSPALFVQALALIFPRQDGGKDPQEWGAESAEKNDAIGGSAYHLLQNIKRIPGTDDAGKINQEKLLAWVKEAQAFCQKYGRPEKGDEKIGELLSRSTIGEDGIWPCEPIRKVLEECGTPKIATGVQNGVFNSHGAHFREEGGTQERALAEKYRNWSRKLTFEYPYVANLVEGIAKQYDRQANWEDSDSAVQKRLRH